METAVNGSRPITGAGRRPGRPKKDSVVEPAWKTLAELMVLHGFTEESLAQKVQVHKNSVGHWKSGKYHPRPMIILRLVKFLNTDRETLLRDAPHFQKKIEEN